MPLKRPALPAIEIPSIAPYPISCSRNVMTGNNPRCCFFLNVYANETRGYERVKYQQKKQTTNLSWLPSRRTVLPIPKRWPIRSWNRWPSEFHSCCKSVYCISCKNFSRDNGQPEESNLERTWFQYLKASVFFLQKDASVFQKLKQRLVAGFSLGFLAIVSIFAGDVVFTAALTMICVLGQLEYYRMARAKGHFPAHRAGIFVGVLQNITAYAFPMFADTIFPIGGTLICCYLLFRKQQATIADISTSFMGLFYAGYLPSYWIRLHALQNLLGLGPPNVVLRFLPSVTILGWKPLFSLGACLTFWTWLSIVGADVGAYFIGKLFGRTKFIEISPKKTVEGALGGFLGSTCISLFTAYLLHFPFWYITGAVYGMMIGVVGLLGDLTASLFKRDAGFKDSGNIIPGHGGILDRTDSYVFTAPLVYYFVTILLPSIVKIFTR